MLANNDAPLDYGPLVILKHEEDTAGPFFTLYGHLATETLARLKIGQRVTRGEELARIGGARENGGWPPHLHFQIILDLWISTQIFPAWLCFAASGLDQSFT